MINIIKTKHFRVRDSQLTEKCPYSRAAMIGSFYCLNVCDCNMSHSFDEHYINVKCHGKIRLGND